MSLDLIATIYGETPQGGTVESPVPLTGVSSFKVDSNTITLPIPRPLRRVGDVRDVCVTRQEYEGTEKLVVTYNVGFVELDGTEVWARYARISTVGGNFYEMPIPKKPKASNVQVTGTLSSHLTCDNAYTKKVDCVWAFVNTQGAVSTLRIGFSDDSIDTAEKVNAYLAAQKAAGTPVQVAYQLATPETYAIDPLDIYVTTMFPVVVSTGPITYEVIPQIHPFKTDWKIQPKTPEGYYNGDWFEIEDYNHILDNYQTIYKIAKALYPDLQIPTFVSPTLGAPTKASEINTIERTIDAFKTLTIALSDVGATKTWLDNGNLFNFEDINRWEQVALSYYTVFLGQVELLPKLQFKLGGAQF